MHLHVSASIRPCISYPATYQKGRLLRAGYEKGCSVHQKVVNLFLRSEKDYLFIIGILGEVSLWARHLHDFFIHLQREKGFSVPAVKGYRLALNHVFSLERRYCFVHLEW